MKLTGRSRPSLFSLSRSNTTVRVLKADSACFHLCQKHFGSLKNREPLTVRETQRYSGKSLSDQINKEIEL